MEGRPEHTKHSGGSGVLIIADILRWDKRWMVRTYKTIQKKKKRAFVGTVNTKTIRYGKRWMVRTLKMKKKEKNFCWDS